MTLLSTALCREQVLQARQQGCVTQQLLLRENFSWELSPKPFSKCLLLIAASAPISL